MSQTKVKSRMYASKLPLERVCDEETLKCAWERVRANGGAPGADGGWTWTKPALPDSFRQPVSRCSCIRLASGRWLLVKNGFTPMEIVTAKPGENAWWAARTRLTAFVSEDEGKTWKGGLRLDPRERVAYLDAFQSPDGSIYVTYDHDRNTKTDQLLFAKFTEADVLAGKVVTPGMSLQNVIFSEEHQGASGGEKVVV